MHPQLRIDDNYTPCINTPRRPDQAISTNCQAHAASSRPSLPDGRSRRTWRASTPPRPRRCHHRRHRARRPGEIDEDDLEAVEKQLETSIHCVCIRVNSSRSAPHLRGPEGDLVYEASDDDGGFEDLADDRDGDDEDRFEDEYDSDDDGPARRRGPPTRVARRKAVTPKSASNSDLFACPLPTLHRSWYVVHSLDLLAVLPVFVLENVVCATAHANWTLPGDLLSFETCPLLRPDELSGHIVFKTAATRRLSGRPPQSFFCRQVDDVRILKWAWKKSDEAPDLNPFDLHHSPLDCLYHGRSPAVRFAHCYNLHDHAV